MRKFKAGIIGMGFIGVSHIEAIRRLSNVEIVAIADANTDVAKKRAQEYQINKYYSTVDEILADEAVEVIHNCTPNYLHLEINKAAILAGKHIFSEKPLTRNVSEAQILIDLLKEHSEIVAGVNFNYRMNPLVQEIRQRIRNGEIGAPRLIHGSYLQDWLLYDTDYNWRLEPEISGPSRCVADIGSHWMDCAQFLLDAKITEVSADIMTAIPVRKKPKGQVETFSRNQNTEYEEKKIETEDYAAVLFRMDNGVRGVFYVSQVSAGHGCMLNFEVNGTKSSFGWNQEQCDLLWQGFRDEGNRYTLRNPNNFSPEARQYTHLAKGHPEGWNDAFKNNIQSFYRYIAERESGGNTMPAFTTMEDAAYIMRITEAILESGKTGQWIKL